MRHQGRDVLVTSRRQFAKGMIAAAVAAPIAASIMSCQNKSTNANLSAAPTTDGPSMVACRGDLTTEEHIPPMELDGSGSLRVELSNKIETRDTSSPFRYYEVGINNANDRYGELESVLV